MKFSVLKLIFSVIVILNLQSRVIGESGLKINARLMECSKKPTCDSKPTKADSHDFDINNVDISEGIQPEFKGPVVLKECLRKLYITVQINNLGQVSGDDDYIVIDEVDDPVTGSISILLSPIVLKLRLEQAEIVYPLDFTHVVNGEAHEETIKMDNDADGACDSSICGETKYDGSVLPYSQGFCCTCGGDIAGSSLTVSPEAAPTPLRDPSLVSYPVKRSIMKENHNVDKKSTVVELESMSKPCPYNHNYKKSRLPIYFFEHDKALMKEGKERLCSLNKKKHKKDSVYLEYSVESPPTNELLVKKTKRNTRRSRDTFQAHVDRERLKKVLSQRKRNLGKKKRQSCYSENEPEPTAHCLRFSDLWYSVYNFEDPTIVQEVTLQVFQKRDAADGSCYWTDLTRGKVIRLGTHYPQASDQFSTIALSYSSTVDPAGRCFGDTCPIDPNSHVLLIPTNFEDPSYLEDHPEAKGGPKEFLVVPRDDISSDGRGCDQAGTMFEGFSQQSDRCDQLEGTCLNRQPIDFWIHDMNQRISEEPGKYFVENFGSPDKFSSDALTLEYTYEFNSLLEIEMRAENNAIYRKGWNIQVQSITADSSGPQHTVMEVIVVNTGLASGHFRPWLVECTADLPPDAVPEGPLVLISPQHRHIFQIIIDGPLPTASMVCTVEIRNTDGIRIASRQVMVQKLSRCLCAFHCACSCFQSDAQDDSPGCSSLMEEEYAMAGFTGGVGRKKGIPADVPLQMDPIYITFYSICLLTFLGKVKVLLGFKSRLIRTYGLEFLRSYCYCFLCCMNRTAKRELLSRKGSEILLNMFFFILYPLMALWSYCLSLCCLCCACCTRHGGEDEPEKAPLLTSPNRSFTESKVKSVFREDSVERRSNIVTKSERD